MEEQARRGRGAHRPRARTVLALSVLAAAPLLASCGTSSAATSSSGDAATASWTPPACHRPVAPAVTAVPVPGVASDWTLTSFDGTQIRVHWFPRPTATTAHPAPTVLMGPGWSEAGDTDLGGTGDLFGTVSIPDLQRAGFNVLTWDPRGFGHSTGAVEVDSPNAEARDVSRLIDWVATRPGVQLDRPGDPRMGMVGGSYGGGIQWVVAAQDCRVDAITPTIAWHSLSTSLYKTGISKTGWGNLLYDAAAGDSLDPHISSAWAQSNASGQIDAANAAWFAARGPGSLVAQVHVPTLIVQGTVDTLFTLDEGITNYGQLRTDHVPVDMRWFCGGHGVCLTNPGDPTAVERATVAWLVRWVERVRSTSTGPPVEIIDQHGVRYSAARYPLAQTTPLRATGSGTLDLTSHGGSGPFSEPSGGPGSSSPLAAAAFSILPARAQNAVDVRVSGGGHPAFVVGAPEVTLTYRGTSTPGPRPPRVFAQLVDDTTGLVVGSQVTPIPVVLDGGVHTTRVPLEVVSQSVAPGQALTLQLVATTVAYATPRLGGSVDFSKVAVSLPVLAAGAVTVTNQP